MSLLGIERKDTSQRVYGHSSHPTTGRGGGMGMVGSSKGGIVKNLQQRKRKAKGGNERTGEKNIKKKEQTPELPWEFKSLIA